MKKVFFVNNRGARSLATFQGRLIVATTEQEVLAGPSSDIRDLEEITVSDWIDFHVNGFSEKEA